MFENLIPDELKTMHCEAIQEVIRAASRPCLLYFGINKYTDCPNCIFSPVLQRSSNRYQTGGPIPFSTGQCPVCAGEGRIIDEYTESADLAPIYDYRDWMSIASSNVKIPNSYVQTLSKIDTYSLLVQAKEVIIDTALVSKVRQRFSRWGEPEPCGFGTTCCIATMWRRIEGV